MGRFSLINFFANVQKKFDGPVQNQTKVDLEMFVLEYSFKSLAVYYFFPF